MRRKFKTVRRRHEPGNDHSINFTCFKNQKFLSNERACLWFLDSLRDAIENHVCALWAFCVMPDHAHLLVYPKTPTFDGPPFLSDVKMPVTRKAVGWVAANSPSFLERMEDRESDGNVVHRFWQRGGGYDRNLQTPEIIYAEIDYMHDNPMKAGLVGRAIDWRWSSARQWEGLDDGPMLCDWSDLPPRPIEPP